MPNIYLVGMMGSGKSVTGKKLALKLGYSFMDLDDLIQARLRKTIVEVFAEKGEAFFRDEESKLLREVCDNASRVIATGGGAVLKATNVERMKQTGEVVFLETSLEVLWNRVKEKQDRPLLKQDANPKESLLKIYTYRQPLYEAASSLRVNTDGKTASEVADDIYRLLMENGKL